MLRMQHGEGLAVDVPRSKRADVAPARAPGSPRTVLRRSFAPNEQEGREGAEESWQSFSSGAWSLEAEFSKAAEIALAELPAEQPPTGGHPSMLRAQPLTKRQALPRHEPTPQSARVSPFALSSSQVFSAPAAPAASYSSHAPQLALRLSDLAHGVAPPGRGPAAQPCALAEVYFPAPEVPPSKLKRAREDPDAAYDEAGEAEVTPLQASGRRVSRNSKAKMRREKNKLAARKCRQKKQDTVLDTETKLQQLQNEAARMRASVGHTQVLLSKHVALFSRLQARIASCATADRSALQALLRDSCDACGLAPGDLQALCDEGVLPPPDCDAPGAVPGLSLPAPALSLPDSDAEYVDAHGRPLHYVRACALVCGPSITTGHNAVSESSFRTPCIGTSAPGN